MSARFHRKLIHYSLSLYLIATWSSMAGMEIFGWLTFLLTVTYAVRSPSDDPVGFRDIAAFMPWKACLALLGITVLGLYINGTPSADKVYDIGSQRWIFIFAMLSFSLATCPPTLKGYRIFLGFTSLVAVYAIFQSFTGIDLLRLGSHRAVQELPDGILWRSAGLFGSPLAYGYIAGQHVCLALGMALLTFHERKKVGWLFWGSLAAYVLISLSIITTFTRGAWIAMVCAHLFVAWAVAPRIALLLLGSGTAALGILFATIGTFRFRILSLFDSGYSSNSERVFLWKCNWAMFKDYPILGIGYQENEARAAEYTERLGRPYAFTGHAHNNYIQMLSGTGITGFLAYMFIISFMLWLTWRLWKRLPSDLLWARALTLGCLGAQIHLHIGGLTECNFKAGTENHNFMVVWGLVVAMSALESKGLLRSRYGTKVEC